MTGRWRTWMMVVAIPVLVGTRGVAQIGGQDTVQVREGAGALTIIIGRDAAGMLARVDSVAEAYRQAGLGDSAIARYRWVLEEYLVKSGLDAATRTSVQVLYTRRMAACYAQDGETDAAVATYGQLIPLARANRLEEVETAALLAMARVARSPAALAGVVAAYEERLGQTDPPEEWVLTALGALYRRQGRFPDADRASRRAIELQIESVQGGQLALSYFVSVAPERWDALQEALAAVPADQVPEVCRRLVAEGTATDEEAQCLLAAQAWRVRRYADARAVLQRMRSSPFLTFQIALSYLGEGRRDEALTALNRVRVEDVGLEERCWLLLDVADACYLAGDETRAKATYTQLATLAPGSPQAAGARIKLDLLNRIGR